jgi:hypothetical protein
MLDAPSFLLGAFFCLIVYHKELGKKYVKQIDEYS